MSDDLSPALAEPTTDLTPALGGVGRRRQEAEALAGFAKALYQASGVTALQFMRAFTARDRGVATEPFDWPRQFGWPAQERAWTTGTVYGPQQGGGR